MNKYNIDPKALASLLNDYISGCEDNLESDNFLPGMDVKLEAAQELFDDVVTFIANAPDKE